MSTTVDYPFVTAIILNWTRTQEILACLTSLFASDYSSLRVVVVDNNSRNGSIDLIRLQFPDVEVIESAHNLGFAAGNNVGMTYALNLGASYVLLLNDDTEIASDTVSRLVQAAETDPRIGIVGPTIYYFDRPHVIWSAGGNVSQSGIPTHRLIDERDRNRSESIQDADYVTGCAMLVRDAVVRSVGGLDERFFAYFEETEWCSRATRAGFRVVYQPTAQVWHKIEATARGQSPTYLYLMTRNRLLFLRCRGANAYLIARTIAQMGRSALRMLLHDSRQRSRRLAEASLLGIVDFVLGHFGPPRQLIGDR